jgi:putative ribosome biogenesis GTPase RsgA
VGDQVTVAPQPDGSGVIEAVAPRRSVLERPGFHGYTHVMAANLDQVVVQAALVSAGVDLILTSTATGQGLVSAWSTKGKHTTTSSRLYPIPGGGYIADTPGIRTLELYEDDDEGAPVELFPEIAAHASGCKFRDCSHVHEPHCAVKAAVEAGQIPAVRYQNWLRLQKAR